MTAVVADTHSILWFLFDPSRLSPTADAALSLAATSGRNIRISAISIIEVLYLVEKGRVSAQNYDDLIHAVHDPAIPLDLVPVDLEITKAIQRIPRDVVPDLPDRIIAATALAEGLSLVTRDSKIRAATQIHTIW